MAYSIIKSQPKGKGEVIIFRLFLISVLSALLSAPALADPGFPRLRDAQDSLLQQGLETAVERLGLKRAVSRKALAVALVDITDPTRPRYAALNGEHMMYAASLPKIAILLGAFARIAEGSLANDADTRTTLIRMIRNSSNQAASRMLALVGMPYLAKVLQSDRYRLYDPQRNGGLWVGRPYGNGPAWKRDPLHNVSHGANALQVARFYYLLETGRLVSRNASQQMKNILAEPAIKHKFVKGLAQSHPGARIYRKSGTWRSWHSDSAIVERDQRRYIAVALADSPQGGEWLTHIISELDQVVFGVPAPPAHDVVLR